MHRLCSDTIQARPTPADPVTGGTERSDPVGIDVPRDRDGSFGPQIVKKRQRRLAGVDEMALSLYAKGLTTGEISAHFAEIYGVSVSKETISRITDKVIEEMTDWCSRPLDGVWTGSAGCSPGRTPSRPPGRSWTKSGRRHAGPPLRQGRLGSRGGRPAAARPGHLARPGGLTNRKTIRNGGSGRAMAATSGSRVLIVGGGFADLFAARALRRAACR